MSPQLAPDDQAAFNANSQTFTATTGNLPNVDDTQGDVSSPAVGFTIPGDSELWLVGGQYFLVWTAPGADPPIPLAYVATAEDITEIFGTAAPAPTVMDQAAFNARGTVTRGSIRLVANRAEHPFDQMSADYAMEAELRPWLLDPEMVAIRTAAILEGRDVTALELQSTEWYQTHNDGERAWLLRYHGDPASAAVDLADQHILIRDSLEAAGVFNPSDDLVSTLATNQVTGKWSSTYVGQQILLLSDPFAAGDLDPALSRVGVDTTRGNEEKVRDLVNTWLGPSFGKWETGQIAEWAGKLRNDPDGETALTEMLRNQRKSLFPEYDASLTYQEIAAPWRNVWFNSWGQRPDESSAMFNRIVRLNDVGMAETLLRQEGIAKGNTNVTNDALGDLVRQVGGTVRQAL